MAASAESRVIVGFALCGLIGLILWTGFKYAFTRSRRQHYEAARAGRIRRTSTELATGGPTPPQHSLPRRWWRKLTKNTGGDLDNSDFFRDELGITHTPSDQAAYINAVWDAPMTHNTPMSMDNADRAMTDLANVAGVTDRKQMDDAGSLPASRSRHSTPALPDREDEQSPAVRPNQYRGSAVWVDQANGNHGRVSYLNGRATNPVNNLSDAIAIARDLNLGTINVDGVSMSVAGASRVLRYHGDNSTISPAALQRHALPPDEINPGAGLVRPDTDIEELREAARRSTVNRNHEPVSHDIPGMRLPKPNKVSFTVKVLLAQQRDMRTHCPGLQTLLDVLASVLVSLGLPELHNADAAINFANAVTIEKRRYSVTCRRPELEPMRFSLVNGVCPVDGTIRWTVECSETGGEWFGPASTTPTIAISKEVQTEAGASQRSRVIDL